MAFPVRCAPTEDRIDEIIATARAAALDRLRGPLTDLWNAERFRDRNQHTRFVHGIGWHTFDGKRWKSDASGEVVRRMVETIRSIYGDAADLEDADTRARAMKHAIRSEQGPRMAAALTLAQSLEPLALAAEELDRNPLVFNVANGTLHFPSGELRPHNPDDLITKLSPLAYDPRARAPTWERIVAWAFCGRPELVSYFQRACGYMLTGLVREQVWFLLHGNGRNGKTTLLEVVEEVLGDYAVRAMSDVFLGASGHPTELAALAGSRMVLAIEPEMGKPFRDGLLKAVTGEARMTARRMHRDPFTFPITFKIVIAANHLPPVRDTSDGFWRRVRRLPFDNQIGDADVDPTLKDKLRAELPGVLAWMVRGAVAWFREGLGTVPEVEAATKAYREEQDQLRRFIEEECELTGDAWVKTAGLYEAFRAWCDRNGERPPARQEFTSRLGRVDGVREARRGYGRGFQGIGLRAGAEVTQ